MEVIHYSRCRMVPTPSSLAASLGLFKEWTGTDAVRTKFEYGDFDHKDDRLWLRHAANAKAMCARAEGAATRVVAFSTHEAADPVYVLATSSICTPADLKGKRIALPRIAERAFDMERLVYTKPFATCLASAGLTMADVKIVDSDFVREKVQDREPEPKNFFEELAEVFAGQLLCGEVDAIAAVLPPGFSESGQFRLLYDSRSDPHPWARGEMRALTVSEALLAEHRPVVVELVACLMRAGQWAAEHPSDVAPRVAGELYITGESLDSREIDLKSWSQIDCSLGQIELMRHRKKFLQHIGIMKGDVDIDAWIDPAVVVEARAMLVSRSDEPLAA